MRKAILLLPLAVALTVGPAIARPNAQAMSCAAAQSMVQANGSVIFDTGPHTFEKVVSAMRFCVYDQIIENRWIATRDTRSCAAGFRCIPRPSIDDE